MGALCFHRTCYNTSNCPIRLYYTLRKEFAVESTATRI